ncbi:G protein-coupled receptor rhodopsin-like [Trinorchestia longiramus]|nr:G protein-coupled receptor rhodopsin-like [Trinorchestia longiramus]
MFNFPTLRFFHQATPRNSQSSKLVSISDLFQNCTTHGGCQHNVVRSLVMQTFAPSSELPTPPMMDVGAETPVVDVFEQISTTNSIEAPLNEKLRFNFSSDTLKEIIHTSKKEGYISATAETAFVVCYVIVILAGVIGNVLVGYVIWRKKTMRTPRNLYIINLTFSDLSMCIFCMPFTLIQLLNKDFNLGTLICKLIQVIQGTNIMVSISTIVAIAADRYAAIVVGLSERSQLYVSWSLAVIWTISIASTLPLFSWYEVVPVKLYQILLYKRCVITWPSTTVKYTYIVMLMIMMYVIPIIVLSTIHAAIKRYLSRHMMNQHDSRRAQKEIDRNRKTTMLLTAIAVAFGVSWLPWQIVNPVSKSRRNGFIDPKRKFAEEDFRSCNRIQNYASQPYSELASPDELIYGFKDQGLDDFYNNTPPSLSTTGRNASV